MKENKKFIKHLNANYKKKLNLSNYLGKFERKKDCYNLYSDKFLNIITTILPTSSVFLSYPLKKRIKLNDELMALFKKERTYKAIVKCTPAYSKHIKTIFAKELEAFIKGYIQIIESNKFLDHIDTIVDFVSSSLSTYLNEDIIIDSGSLLRKISSEELFCNLVLIISKNMYKNIMADTTNFLTIPQSQIIYIIREYIYKIIIINIIDLIKLDPSQGGDKISTLHHLFDEEGVFYYNNNNEVERASMSISVYILSLMEDANFFAEVNLINVGSNSIKQSREFKMKEVFKTLDLFVIHLPDIIPPLKWNINGKNSKGDYILKKMVGGTNKAVFSSKAINSLNCMGSTKLTIDPIAINILDSMFREGSNKDLKNKSFITQDELNKGREMKDFYLEKIEGFKCNKQFFYKVLKSENKLAFIRSTKFLKILNEEIVAAEFKSMSSLTKKTLMKLKVSDEKIKDILFQKKKNYELS